MVHKQVVVLKKDSKLKAKGSPNNGSAATCTEPFEVLVQPHEPSSSSPCILS